MNNCDDNFNNLVMFLSCNDNQNLECVEFIITRDNDEYCDYKMILEMKD